MKETHEVMDSIDHDYGQNTKDICSIMKRVIHTPLFSSTFELVHVTHPTFQLEPGCSSLLDSLTRETQSPSLHEGFRGF
jgi:hypothetical protein